MTNQLQHEFTLIAITAGGNIGSRMMIGRGYITVEQLKRAIDERLQSPTKYHTLIAVDDTGASVTMVGNTVKNSRIMPGEILNPGERNVFQFWYKRERDVKDAVTPAV